MTPNSGLLSHYEGRNLKQRRAYVWQSKSSRNTSDWKRATTDSIWSKNDHRGVGKKNAGISHGSIHAILPNDLKMRLVTAKFVPCGFCITMTHRATHRLLCSNSSPRKAFLSPPNHRTLWISLRVTFSCSPFWKCSRGRVSHHGGHRIECDGWTPEDSKRRLPPVHPTMARSMEQVCVCARVSLLRWLVKHCHISYH